MFCDKENVNLLTSLLKSYGVQHAVVCPGSRNAPIVHNLCECEGIECHSVVDERSAGFIALGITAEVQTPVVVCVTSGSALLNVLPAAAEATYQHRGIIVVSADRPQAWIDQLDGQTLPQTGALGVFAGKTVALPEPIDDESRWYCRRLICEAMIEWQRTGKSVHINVPISEPLFSFTVESLPETSPILYTTNRDIVLQKLRTSIRPLIVAGQITREYRNVMTQLMLLQLKVPVLCESLNGDVETFGNPDAALCSFDYMPDDYKPDLIIYIGGHVVSKRIKRYLRRLEDVELWHVSDRTDIQDVSMHMTGLLYEERLSMLLAAIHEVIDGYSQLDNVYVDCWKSLLHGAALMQSYIEPFYSQALAVKVFEQYVSEKDNAKAYYANSSAIRLANIYATDRVECNRGVNGIEGTLSTAVGASIANRFDAGYCVIGDLSFFYDQNALASVSQCHCFRILLLNNGCGGIFHQLPGLDKSTHRDNYVSASHCITAEGVCSQYGVEYRKTTGSETLCEDIEWLVHSDSEKPLLLEVITDPLIDADEYNRLFECLREMDKSV